MKKFCISVMLILMLIAAGGLLAPPPSLAVTPDELRERLAGHENITVIDIRGQAEYSRGHVPGALNIPASIIGLKRLPPIGTVVVYGDGIRTDIALEAVEALNLKKGIAAEMLDGGFPAWDAFNLATSQNAGLEREQFTQLTHDDLVEAAKVNGDMVLVDLRGQTAVEMNRPAAGPSRSAAAPVDLKAKFPRLRSIKLRQKRTAAGEEWDIAAAILAREQQQPHRDLYVLVDAGNGESEKVARRLKGAGVRRIAILVGGEEILRQQGKETTETTTRTQR